MEGSTKSTVEIDWEGPINGALVVSGATTDSITCFDELAVVLNLRAADFAAKQLRVLGNCAFFFALREALGNDPLLPAADRIMGSAALTFPDIVDTRAYAAGWQELREFVFAIRGSVPSEILKAAHDHLMSILTE